MFRSNPHLGASQKPGAPLSGLMRLALVFVLITSPGWSQSMGTLSGKVTDPTGAVIPDAILTLTNDSTGLRMQVKTDQKGYYSFPALAVGQYTLRAQAEGFTSKVQKGLTVDVNAQLRVDASLTMAEKQENVTVAESAEQVQPETSSTQLGDVVSGAQMTAVPLNGRSYTDLLALQPGIVPQTTQTPDSIVMAGASVAIAPSGGLNSGNQSIGGQREDANGFLVNGADVKELMNGGTAIIPNIDSLAEFRILTSNFDAQYGDYAGGIVNVITKSGSNQTHGTAFDFLRNTLLDARAVLAPHRSVYRQNQFGGAVGGPVIANKLFYFVDYQGTRTAEGINTGLISVPSVTDRTGNLADVASALTGTVSGPYLANLLANRLGYAVSAAEPYYFAGCVSSVSCVFPNAVIPARAWSIPAQHLLPYIPLPNASATTFSTGSNDERLRDDKGSFRLDAYSSFWGMLQAYYFIDDFFVNNPYPTGQGGASVPGFNALNLGRAQLINLGDTKTIGASAVNEFRLSYMRSDNIVGQPSGGVGPTLASQGFVTGVGTPGIVPLNPAIEGIENVIFNSFVMGTPITNLAQTNNTWSLNDNFSKTLGTHNLKTGLEFSAEQVNVNPNPTANGSFLFSGSETGSDFADFLIGVASNYNQADSEAYYPRHRYAGAFLQDSWRVAPNLSLNYGVRWDLMRYWSEKHNQIPTFVSGEQSVVYPNAPLGLVYPGDPGVPNTLVPQRNRFSPRIGIAFSPTTSSGFLGRILGGPGKSSIRAGYGIFYSVIEGNTIAFDQPQPPYGLSYTSPGPPLFSEPFITAANGAFSGNPFPLTFPPLNASASHPNAGITFSQFEPVAGMTTPPPSNTYPYTEHYFFSLERQLGAATLWNITYAGSQAHHLLLVYSANPGNPNLCVSLSQPSEVAPASPLCRPFGEDILYTNPAGVGIQGTRAGLGPAFSNDDYEGSVGNSSYNSLQVSLHHTGPQLTSSLAYTYSKSLDEASSLSDPVDPYNYKLTRALSAFNLAHNFVGSFDYSPNVEGLRWLPKALTRGWVFSGILRASTGFPVTLRSTGDNSLLGSIPNGVNNYSLDLPDYNGSPVKANTPGTLQYLNPAAFSLNVLGTLGTASRRSFSGPGMLNVDVALLRNFNFLENKVMQVRFETFNTLNHTQFFGPAAVNGNISSPLFGHLVQAAPPRLVQLALKFSF